ncbi:MAG: protein translocase subunit SecF [Candidatus Aenigmatarchaeota archaeon]
MLQFFDKYYKVWIFIPISLLVVSILILGSNIITKGSFMERDIELTGGKMITAEVENADIAKIQAALPYAVIHLTGTKNLLVEIPFEKDEKIVLNELSKLVTVRGEPTIRTVGPALGGIFWQQAQSAIVFAFLAMATLVFILFRKVVPSLIVILAAITDIVVTIAVIDMIGVKLSMPVLAALLMLIGYSVDTDIVLTSNLLKIRGGAKERSEIRERIRSAMKTGLMMSITALAALVSLYLLTGSYVLEQIATVLIIGIVADLPATWFANAGILRWWLEK